MAALALVSASPAAAHLRAVGGSLAGLLAESDGVVVARALESTQDPPAAQTRMRTVRGLAGAAPGQEFALRNAPAPMRYARDQTAIVVLRRDRDGWSAVQSAGEGLVFEGKAVDPATADFVGSLWAALHDAAPRQDVEEVLRRGLRLPHAKIRLLAALDIGERAQHGPGLAPETRSALHAVLRDPKLDPAVRLALSRALEESVP